MEHEQIAQFSRRQYGCRFAANQTICTNAKQTEKCDSGAKECISDRE